MAESTTGYSATMQNKAKMSNAVSSPAPSSDTPNTALHGGTRTVIFR
ncbi:hypothetical protein [Mobiluncus mulieris]|nr:hypothetical protein [Mobiluncus mulieris]